MIVLFALMCCTCGVPDVFRLFSLCLLAVCWCGFVVCEDVGGFDLRLGLLGDLY